MQGFTQQSRMHPGAQQAMNAGVGGMHRPQQKQPPTMGASIPRPMGPPAPMPRPMPVVQRPPMPQPHFGAPAAARPLPVQFQPAMIRPAMPMARPMPSPQALALLTILRQLRGGR